ncbi:hypothetical protein HMPREF9182_1993 [Streptococcus sp. oral taxon 056 str. F0418]|nr:hypothetical protein HMPREF9182_1993 [Streptococcus sp. oral taxon 056 str. F0418]
MWDEKRRVLKMTSLKQGIIQDKEVKLFMPYYCNALSKKSPDEVLV